MLKKEFNRKDVERARNLIRGKTGDSSNTQVGYRKKTIKYKEGDVWVENKKTWTIKNGIKQTISKLDKIKKEIYMPLCCPKCNKVMKAQLDKPNYKIHKKCLNCVIEEEHKLRYTGKYENYIKKLKAKNSLDMIDEMESYLLDAINSTNTGFISEQGEVERWVGGIDKKKISKEVKKAIQKRTKSIKKELNDSE